VFLLYDLQEKAEDRYHAGGITSATAADLIASIVDAKASLFENKPGSDVQQAINIARTKWQEAMG